MMPTWTQQVVHPSNLSNILLLIVDSGATDHIINDVSRLTHVKNSYISSINLPTSTTTPISHTGTFSFNKDVQLEDVLYVPCFNLNLLSISHLTKTLNYCIILFSDFCILQDLATRRMVGSSSQCKVLYYMSSITPSLIVMHVLHTLNLWHYRLEHPSLSRLKLLYIFNNNISPYTCDVYSIAKQIHKHFPTISISSK